MNEMEIFKNEEFGEVRVVDIDNEPWFVASDVCKALDLKNTTTSIVRLDDDEKSKLNLGLSGGSTNCVNEYGLYSLVLASRKKEAKEFKRWITHDVIPTIRKTGGYVNNDELFINTYLPYVDETTKTMFRSTLQTVRKQNELIQQQKLQIEQQQEDLDHKEDVIIGLVDDLELAEKRQILNRVVRYNHANYQERWSLLYKEFDNKYHIDTKRRMNTYNETHKPKVKNRVDYIDKVMGKIPELYEIAAKLFETDVKALIKEMYVTIK